VSVPPQMLAPSRKKSYLAHLQHSTTLPPNLTSFLF